jgi:hypothetical protein
MQLHKLPAKQRTNATSQASQIRFCLTQAQEYFASAEGASLATRPLLLYYALMSLALAEILVKGSGDDRLSRLRQEHPAHGLSLAVDGEIGKGAPLGLVLQRIRSVPQLRAMNIAFGTFEVWRRQMRESPVPVEVSETLGNGSGTRGYVAGFAALDTPPQQILGTGLTLGAAIASLPQLRQVLVNLGVESPCVRATVKQQLSRETRNGQLSMIVHPQEAHVLARLYDLIKFEASAVNTVVVEDQLTSGIALVIPIANGAALARVSLPPAVTLDSQSVYFVVNGWALGEFGSFYVALHALGNLVRYYPDLWMPHVERSTPFALLAQELCDSAALRLPVLAAGELDRRYYFAA